MDPSGLHYDRNQRTSRTLAKRVHANYIALPDRSRRWRSWVLVLVILLAVCWLAWHDLRIKGHRIESLRQIYKPRPVSRAHAMFENNCAACHGRGEQAFSLKVSDASCLRCHDAA